MDTMDTNFDDFFGTFEGADGNQTDTDDTGDTAAYTEEPADTEGAEEDTDPAEDPTDIEASEPAETDTDDEAEKDAEDSKEEPGQPDPNQKFTIKVNKETREVSLTEMTELAQKGADYDRVKGQLDTIRQNEQALQTQVNEQKPFMDFLEMAAEQSGISREQLVESLHINLLKSRGMTEAEARAEIRAATAEKQVKDLTAQQAEADKKPAAEDPQARMQRDIEEFRKEFPGVELTTDQIRKMGPDIRNGMSMVTAYRNMRNAEKDAEIAELKRQLEAEKQNKKNRAKTPGSQRDSGGQRTKDAFDGFFDAFEK